MIHRNELDAAFEIVTDYFFSLNPAELRSLLRAYGQRYGGAAQEYARRVYYEWKIGTRGMSGKVGRRLFDLLPSLMPFDFKCKVIEAIWKKFAPRSRTIATFGQDADFEAFWKVFKERLESLQGGYHIPDRIAKNFEWLASGDAATSQALLNHLRAREAQVIFAKLMHVTKLFLLQVRSRDKISRRIVHSTAIDGHSFEFTFDSRARGVVLNGRQAQRLPSIWERLSDWMKGKHEH